MKNIYILYVEDEPDIRLIAKMAMENLGGFTICECTGGAEAIQSVGGFTPDVLLLDVMMPGMNGLETLRNLRQLPVCEKTPAIFMTAKVQANEVEEYYTAGAIGVIPKPFDPMTLSQQILDLWEKFNASKTKAG